MTISTLSRTPSPETPPPTVDLEKAQFSRTYAERYEISKKGIETFLSLQSQLEAEIAKTPRDSLLLYKQKELEELTAKIAPYVKPTYEVQEKIPSEIKNLQNATFSLENSLPLSESELKEWGNLYIEKRKKLRALPDYKPNQEHDQELLRFKKALDKAVTVYFENHPPEEEKTLLDQTVKTVSNLFLRTMNPTPNATRYIWTLEKLAEQSRNVVESNENEKAD